ncbi:hypothetical protein NDU88_001275 [Pleurodeles waltl]|uniref:Uncharacterized protein n=1 Tax=Pleurodeles waltl TaxID=8319 RepID=A0AAV7NJL4_PLEWA|nr:hypothetical protein NDU88_001275 [Pleurodeles waltl]
MRSRMRIAARRFFEGTHTSCIFRSLALLERSDQVQKTCEARCFPSGSWTSFSLIYKRDLAWQKSSALHS